jgi:hypothetical protein
LCFRFRFRLRRRRRSTPPPQTRVRERGHLDLVVGSSEDFAAATAERVGGASRERGAGGAGELRGGRWKWRGEEMRERRQ